MLAPGEGAAATDEQPALEAVAELAAGRPRGKAADLVAGLTGLPRNRLYGGSLRTRPP